MRHLAVSRYQRPSGRMWAEFNVRLNMSPVAPFLEIAVVWNAPDVQEVVVSVSSGKFSGEVKL